MEGIVMGGLPVKTEMNNLILKTWIELRSTGIDPIAKEVRSAVSSTVKGKESEYGRLPQLRTFQEIIREAKKELIKNTSIDAEWSMASLINNDLPPESIPWVIEVWRYCLVCNEKYTTIQAKWVTRLYHKYTDIPYLWYYSKWYSEIERVHLISGKEANTLEMDLIQFLSHEEYRVLRYVHDYKETFWDTDGYIQTATHNRRLIEEIMHYKTQHMHYELSMYIGPLPPLDEAGFDRSSKYIYLGLYSYIIRGPKWDELPPKEAVDIIKQLRKWVLKEYKDSRNWKTNPITGQRTSLHIFQLPFSIFSKVGYSDKKENEYFMSVRD
jgi:hypothetical protein